MIGEVWRAAVNRCGHHILSLTAVPYLYHLIGVAAAAADWHHGAPLEATADVPAAIMVLIQYGRMLAPWAWAKLWLP